MPTLRKILNGFSKSLQPSEDWIELVRDLQAPVSLDAPKIVFSRRWAESKDLLAIDAMQGFVKEIETMDRSLKQGDRCLLMERDGRICAFAWVTFRDYRLSFRHTLHLPAGFAYLVYIHVEPAYRQKGLGTYLLACLMLYLREKGYRRLICGMYAEWVESLRFHMKSGFTICRKYTQRRILRFFPYPPKVDQLDQYRP
jgi:GNAT superfamily N-acetyltransferase